MCPETDTPIHDAPKHIIEGYYYKLVGKEIIPCTLQEWGEAREGNRHVAKTKLKAPAPSKDTVEISTVFLGLDHSMGGGDVPILFETMIFGGQHDEYMERYTTWDEAEKGHQEAVLIVLNDQPLLEML